MRRNGIPRNTHWSFSELVREHGEDEAFAQLQYQPGLGAFTEEASRGWAEHSREHRWREDQLTPRDVEVHDEAPRIKPELPLCYADPISQFLIPFGRGR